MHCIGVMELANLATRDAAEANANFAHVWPLATGWVGASVTLSLV